MRCSRPPTCSRAALLGALLIACSHEAPEAASEPSAKPAAAAQPERTRDPRLAGLRELLEQGAFGEVRQRAADLGESAGAEGFLLRARAAAAEGDGVEAGRLVERARALAPGDAEVFATAAEIHAGAGRYETAWAELRRGEELLGRERAELLRARGVLWITRPGGAEQGVSYLEQAVAHDPALPFVARPLGQGYLVLAKEALAKGDGTRAEELVRKSLARDARDIDARRLLADALLARGDFAGAIAVLEELLGEGVPLQSELALTCKRSALAHLLHKEREAALRDFARARALGLDDRELGVGAGLLETEAARLTRLGAEALSAGEREAAAARFREALAIDPGRIEAEHHLGIALFQLGDYDGAVERWRHVLRVAREEGLELPDPVHLNLAKALVRAGDTEGARLALEEYLDREPGGAWVDATRELLAHLGE